MIHAFEMMSIGYYSLVEKSKTVLHCARRNVSNVFHFPAVTRKLRFLDGVKGIINPYQKPQRLINELLDLYTVRDDWVCDFFAGTGTTTVCALQKKRNCIAVEKDPLQAAFILQRICAINDLPDADQEVGAKSCAENAAVQLASGEPQPAFNNEESELAELFEDIETQAVVEPEPVEETSPNTGFLENQIFDL